MSHHREPVVIDSYGTEVRLRRQRRRAKAAMTTPDFRYEPSVVFTSVHPDGQGHEAWLRAGGYESAKRARRDRKVMKRHARRVERQRGKVETRLTATG